MYCRVVGTLAKGHMNADVHRMENRASARHRNVSPVYGGIASRWCRRFRSTALTGAGAFALAGQIPSASLLDETIVGVVGMPLLSLATAAAFVVTVISGFLYFGNLVILQGAAQRRLRLEDNETGPMSRPYLYLRSFSLSSSSILDRTLALFDYRLSSLSPFTPVTYKLHDSEEEIAQAVAGSGLLVAIGDKRKSYGAAKLHTPDETWQSEFLRLADNAELIFVSAALTEGSKWELQKLFEREDYLSKTIFVMPRNWYSDEWDDLRARCRQLFALELPEYDTRGAYFVTEKIGTMQWYMDPEAFIRMLGECPTRELLNARLFQSSPSGNR
jgi:hypothetical protein